MDIGGPQVIMEPSWGTRNGKSIPFSKMTHQHWSNIYWYFSYVLSKFSVKINDDITLLLCDNNRPLQFKHAINAVATARGEIKKRFNGEILDWIPTYEDEIRWYIGESTRKTLIEKAK